MMRVKFTGSIQNLRIKSAIPKATACKTKAPTIAVQKPKLNISSISDMSKKIKIEQKNKLSDVGLLFPSFLQ